jgi:ubiquitin-conjugating enzyme E2 T
VFLLEVAVPDRYPFEPPKVRFLTPIYHPNIDSGGRICLDTLKMPPKGAWTPSLNLSTVLSTIRLLMSHPNPDDGLVPDITEQYRNDPAAFELEARTRTATHATADRNGQLQDEKPASALLTATTDPPEAPPTTEAEGAADGPACDSHADTEPSQLQVANVPATKPQSKLKKRRRLTASHTG